MQHSDEELKQSDCMWRNALKSFWEHPKLAGETYFQHLLFTIQMGGRLFGCGIVLILHGLFPFICTHTASGLMRRCHEILDERASRTKIK